MSNKSFDELADTFHLALSKAYFLLGCPFECPNSKVVVMVDTREGEDPFIRIMFYKCKNKHDVYGWVRESQYFRMVKNMEDSI